MNIQEVKQRISDLADGEWYRRDNETCFFLFYKELVAKGFGKEEAIDLLESIYYIVSSEYGN